ncbi:unnamed protein product [Closterium sp. NIES-64]|nr:unnamed protein product [Closterium sp. NIES-64]
MNSTISTVTQIHFAWSSPPPLPLFSFFPPSFVPYSLPTRLPVVRAEQPWCVGALAVLRLSFGLCLFFALMLATTAGAKLEDSCQVFQVYGEVAIAGAAVFLVIQLVSIINFIYVWNDSWLNNDKMHKWMAVVSIVCYLLFLTGIILMYIYFAPSSSCSLNIFFITFLLVLVVALTAISVHPKVSRPSHIRGSPSHHLSRGSQHHFCLSLGVVAWCFMGRCCIGPLTTGVMAVYFVFLCWSAIMSEPPAEACQHSPSPDRIRRVA